ncbi:MAG TPA: hypothetical protein VLO30_06205, partial [Chthoniobacterales bacterium]|nr:hypothetical protein [Chthoniobacterales bacterium]
MKPGTLTHTIAVLVSSLSALFTPTAPGAVPHPKTKPGKKSNGANGSNGKSLLTVDPTTYSPLTLPEASLPHPGERFAWKKEIVTTVFWIGEKPSANNPVPNRSSSWDANWTKNYGGLDDPEKSHRHDFIPAKFTPRQNPFYCALPYNDKASTGHRAEAPRVVPWFKEAYQGPGVSTCKGRWIAIRKGNKVAY